MWIKLRKADPDFARKKVSDLLELKRKRNQNGVKAGLNEIKKVIHTSDNVMPALIKAVKSHVTLGEIIGAMREIFGEFREDAIF